MEVRGVLLSSRGNLPNNDGLRLVIYEKAFDPDAAGLENLIEGRFSENGWGGSWRNGVFSYVHYHSTAHEVLACYAGKATVQFGGEQGVAREFVPGMAVVIPAGVAHQNLGASQDFRVIGAYPRGQSPDMCDEGTDLEWARERIARVPMPESDPVFGGWSGSPLGSFWEEAEE